MIQKTKLLIGLFTLLSFNINFSQSEYLTEYDKQMNQLASDVAAQAINKEKLNIAVWYFKDSFRKKTALGDYIAQEFAVYFTNISSGFEVMDRDAIDQILKEHRLNSEGFINPRTAKELGMYIQADAVVTGTVDVANSHSLKVRLKLIDIQTGKILAAIPRNILKDENIKYILHESDINKTINIDENKKRLTRGERYGNPQYVDSKCEKLKIGDYCFENDTNKNYRITLTKSQINNQGKKPLKTLTIRAGGSVCLTDMNVKTYNFEMEEYFEGKWPTMTVPKNYGNFKVETCRSIIYTISSTLRK